MSALTPGQHTAVLRLRDDGASVGVLDWMDENPNDGAPWLGLIMIHADRQHRGLAGEAVAASPSTGGPPAGRGFARACSRATTPAWH